MAWASGSEGRLFLRVSTRGDQQGQARPGLPRDRVSEHLRDRRALLLPEQGLGGPAHGGPGARSEPLAQPLPGPLSHPRRVGRPVSDPPDALPHPRAQDYQGTLLLELGGREEGDPPMKSHPHAHPGSSEEGSTPTHAELGGREVRAAGSPTPRSGSEAVAGCFLG